MKTIYAHETLWCRYESSWSVRSIHATKKGAWLAMRRRLISEHCAGRDNWYRFGRSVYERGEKTPYREHDGYRVKPYVLFYEAESQQ